MWIMVLRTIVLVFIISLLAGGVAGSGQIRTSQIQVLADFEMSKFCKAWECVPGRSWQLRDLDGNKFVRVPVGRNHTYDFPKATHVFVEISVSLKGRVFHAGINIYRRSRLGAPEYELIEDLLGSLDSARARDATMAFIRAHVHSAIHQIDEAPAGRFGEYTIKAGTVGHEQIIRLERPRRPPA